MTLQEAFIALVNAKNPELNLTLGDVVFSDPTPFTAPEGDARNSVVTLTAKPESPSFKGSKDYHFTRFNLTHPNGEDVHSWAVSDLHSNWENDEYALTQFNMNLTNFFPTMDDVVITRWMDDEDPTLMYVKIKLDARLLKWWGAFVVQVADDGKANLMFTNGELDGFR